MSVEWSIVGEAGKAVDATPRAPAALQAQGALVSFDSLAADTMTWTAWLRSKGQAVTLVPELGQAITLYRNGVRYFTGTVTGRRITTTAQGPAALITVSGPWWWMDQIFLSSEIEDQAGNAGERTAYVFATGSPRTHLIALIERSIALGAPIQEGTVASAFAVPRLSLRNMPLAEAVGDIMRWLADGITYFDYAVEGYPALCMQRRAAAATVTLNPANAITPRINIAPRMDLQVEELEIFYARRETVDGKRVTVWDGQHAGEAVSGLPRRQPVVVSGPEKVWDLLPQDFTDSVTVRSAAFMSGNLGQGIDGNRQQPELAAVWQHDEMLRSSGAIPMFTRLGGWEETAGGFQFVTLKNSAVTRIVDRDGNPIPAGYDFYLTAGEPREWWAKDGIESVEARVTVTLSTFKTRPASLPEPDPPAWAQVRGAQTYAYALTSGAIKHVWWATINVTIPLVKTAWPVDTLLIRSEDYAFIHPPEGLAANLLATQNWLPYEGEVDYITEEIPGDHHLGRALNISGFLPETANMRALISGHSIRLSTGENTLRLGSAGRLSYRDLVNRFRQTGADNIVWLVESVSGNPGENPPPDPELEIPVGPEHALLWNGEVITFDGEPLTHTPDPELPEGTTTFAGDALAFDEDLITYND